MIAPKKQGDDTPLSSIVWRCTGCGCSSGNFAHYFTCVLCGSPRPPVPAGKPVRKAA